MLKVMKKKLLVVIAMLVVASGIIFTGSTSTKAKDNDLKYLGKYKLTDYWMQKVQWKMGSKNSFWKESKTGKNYCCR